MAVQVIPRRYWIEFFRWFTQRHRGWRVTAHWQESPLAAVLMVDEHIPVPLRRPGRAALGQLLVREVRLRRLGARGADEETDRVFVHLADPLDRVPCLEVLSVICVRHFIEASTVRLELESRQAGILTLFLEPEAP